MRELMIMAAYFCCMFGTQRPMEMEKQALVIAQHIPVSELDATLPSSPFSTWFEKVVGPKSGVIWQLGECGQPIVDPMIASTQEGTQDSARLESDDIAACVEANAVLPDGLKVVVMIKVGSFKRGITDKPGFNFAMIEQEGDLHLIRRLCDLPPRLRTMIDPKREPVFLPEALSIPRLFLSDTLSARPVLPIRNILLPGSDLNDAAVPPPPVESVEDAGGAVTWGTPITKVEPRYTPAARKVNASGTVEVKITISEYGRVIEAKAISGNPLLRGAAEEAARQWIFKPAILKGAPMASQRILTFVFKAEQ